MTLLQDTSTTHARTRHKHQGINNNPTKRDNINPQIEFSHYNDNNERLRLKGNR